MHVSEPHPNDPRANAAKGGDVVAKAYDALAYAKRLLAELEAARPATPAYRITNEGPRR
jgi:hypothetical protein